MTQNHPKTKIKEVATEEIDANPKDFKPTDRELYFNEVLIYKFTEPIFCNTSLLR